MAHVPVRTTPLEKLLFAFYLVPYVPFILALLNMNVEYSKLYWCKVCADNQTDSICKLLEAAPWLDKFNFKLEIYFLLADGLLYALIILLIDFRAFKILWGIISRFIYASFDNRIGPVPDADVIQEKKKVQEILQKKDISYVLAANSLKKKYWGDFVAVGDATFAVAKGECFGLLGVNGAGKTTTFNMLTGREFPTLGNAYSGDYNVKWNTQSYLKRLGFCPQFGGLDEQLSGRQLLHFFGRLRGIRRTDLFTTTEKWIRVLEMSEIGDRACGNYSGGNKRKLSAAISIIGDFPVILLDEPTTGVDPVVRRKMWGVLKQCQSTGRAVVISSHSMDECEALCNRLAVMAAGYLKCIGPIFYLKQKYGKGYVMTIRLSLNITATSKQEIKSAVESKFRNDCELEEEYFDSLIYKIGNRVAPKWSDMFQLSNELKNRFSDIDDCAVSDISLEQLFLSFGRRAKNK